MVLIMKCTNLVHKKDLRIHSIDLQQNILISIKEEGDLLIEELNLFIQELREQ